MKRVIAWQRLDTAGLEYAEIEFDPLRFEGEVVLIENGEPCVVSYRVECDEAEMTLGAFVRLRSDGSQRECKLLRGPGGQWTMNGAPMPQLDGLADVDLSVTPSTNTLPIRRLRLKVGQVAQVTAAWVRFPALDVVPLQQTYRRVGVNSYEYKAPELHFSARLECDDEGIVQSYGDLWTVSLSGHPR